MFFLTNLFVGHVKILHFYFYSLNITLREVIFSVGGVCQ